LNGETATRAPLPVAPGAWLLLAPESLPDAWRGRSVPLAGVWLHPDEIAALATGDDAATPERSDRDLVPLVLQGLPHDDIARVLNVSVRTLQRRLARLRARVGARSQAELVTILAHRTAAGRGGARTSHLSEDAAPATAKSAPPPGPAATRRADR